MVTRRKTKPADETREADAPKPAGKAPQRRAKVSVPPAAAPERPAAKAATAPKAPTASKPAEAPKAAQSPKAEDHVWPAAADHEQRVRDRAYALWEDAGGEHGFHADHWSEAERQINEEDGGTATEVTGRAAGAT